MKLNDEACRWPGRDAVGAAQAIFAPDLVYLQLLVIAHPAAQIACPGNVAHLRNRRRRRTGLGKHVAHLGDLAFRLLRRSVELQAKVAGRILERSRIHAGGNRNRTGEALPIGDPEAEWVKIAVPKASLSFVE